MREVGMALRNDDWELDTALQDELAKYVAQGMQRNEILDFVQRHFPMYAWSLRTLDRRLRHFNIFYTDKNVTVEQLKAAVTEELAGPGKLLGYRPMHKKLRQVHGLNVPRDLVYAAVTDLDPEGLEGRAPKYKRVKKKM